MKDICVFSTPVEPMADMAVDLLMEEGIPARKSIAYRELCPWIGNVADLGGLAKFRNRVELECPFLDNGMIGEDRSEATKRKTERITCAMRTISRRIEIPA